MSLKPETLQSYYDMDEQGRYRIEVCLGTHYAAFDELDPAPVEKRALDTRIGQYIENSVNELPVKAPIVLNFYLDMPSSLRNLSMENQTTHGIRNNFLFQYHFVAEEVATFRKRAVSWILIAVLLMMIQIIGTLGVTNASTSSTFIATLRELVQTGLTVCTWVFLWEGISIIAFQLPQLRRRFARSHKLLYADIRYFYAD